MFAVRQDRPRPLHPVRPSQHAACSGSCLIVLSALRRQLLPDWLQGTELLSACRDFQPNVISAVQAFAVALSTFDTKVLL